MNFKIQKSNNEIKNFLKKAYRLALRGFAVRYLKHNKLEIIAITGSVGKTSTKDAVYQVLSEKFKVKRTLKSKNDEVGVPATILGLKIEKFPFGWIKNIFLGKLNASFVKDQFDKIILEMGADHPGDIKYLTSFVKPKIAIVTRVACSHLEFFGSLENIAREKGALVEALPKGGWAILNYDDQNVRSMGGRTQANVLMFGINKKADIYASNIKYTPKGITFDVNCDGEKQAFHMNVIGRHYVYSALPAIACGMIFGISLKEMAVSLAQYKLPPDRTNILSGIKNTVIISDVYNANPESTKAALETLADVSSGLNKKARKVFIFGDMLELGPKSPQIHVELAREKKGEFDVLVLVGGLTENIFNDLKTKLKKNIYWFSSSEEAAGKIGQIIQKDDIILVKGSRGMKMEKVVEAMVKNS